MWGLERMFAGKVEKKPKVDALAAEREAKAVIAKAAKKAELPAIGTDSGFQDTEPMADLGESIPKIGDSSRLLIPKPVREDMPVSTEVPTDGIGLPGSRIDKKTLESNLATPVLPRALLPRVGQVSDPIAPNRWGADQVRPPKTGYQATPVSDRGLDEFRIDPRTTEKALVDPLPAMAHHKPRYDHADGMYDKQQARMRTAPNANVAPLPDLRTLEGIEIEQLDPNAERDAKWQQAKENFQATDGSPVPASLRGGELPLASSAERLKERQRIADTRSAEGLGVYNGRPAALPTENEKWESARRVAQEGDMKAVSDRVAAAERGRGGQVSLGAQESAKEATREVLRARYWDKVLELRQMIVLAATPEEKELMQDVLDRSLANYKRDFGDFPVEA